MTDTERAAMDRCYEVDRGQGGNRHTHDEGTVQGEVTNMLYNVMWRGVIGFRQLDAMEVKWNGNTGALRMGEIEMWEQWRKPEVGEGQEGEGREMQPAAGVSTTRNETDARDRDVQPLGEKGGRPQRTGGSAG